MYRTISPKSKYNVVAFKYYYDNKDDEKLKLSRSTYYYRNKTKIIAMRLAKCEHDPIFRAQYQRYQALCSQTRTGCKNANEKRGRPANT